MTMTVGRVLWIVAVVLLCASCAFLASRNASSRVNKSTGAVGVGEGTCA